MCGLENPLPPQRWMLLAAALLLGVVPEFVHAQAPAPDYSSGFELLRRAGLPDVKDWKYVNFEDQYGQYRSEMLRQVLQMKKPSGNAWAEPQAGANGLRRLVQQGGGMIAVTESANQEGFAKAMKDAQAMGLMLGNGKLKDADEKADATELAAQIVKAMGDESMRAQVMQQRDQLAGVFFTAAHLHRRGFVKESTEIVNALLKALPRQEALVEVSVDSLGDMRLNQAIARFNGSRDWKALQAELESLAADFPEFWLSRPLVERLLPQVKSRASGQPPPAIAAGSLILTEEQKAWWQKLTEAPAAEESDAEDPMGMYGHGMQGAMWGGAWLAHRMGAPEEMTRQWGMGRVGKAMGPFDPAKDWDWITVFSAGLGDTTFTTMSRQDRFGGYGMSYRSFEPENPPAELSEQELEERWNMLSVPLSRDDIARAFLGAVLPIPEDMGGSYGVARMNADDLRAMAKSWLAKMAGKNAMDLTRLYLKEGTEQHRRTAANLLVRTGNEADFALLEEMALNSPMQSMDTAMQILQKRKAAGKPFLEKHKTRFMEEVKERYGADDPDGSKIPDHFKAQLQALEGVVSGRGIKDLLADYAAGKADEAALMGSVQAMGNDHKWTQEEIEAVFATIGKVPATEGKKRHSLLDLGARALFGLLRTDSQPQAVPTPANPDDKTAATPPPEWVLKLFKDVVEQNRDVEVMMWNRNPAKLSQYACFMADGLWGGMEAMQQSYGLLQQLPPEDCWPLFEARGMARLEGKTPPPLPDSGKVTEPRKQELKAAFKKIGEGVWHSYYAGLNLDEKLLVPELIRDVEPEDSWKKQSLLVTEVALTGGPAAKPEGWKGMDGRTIDVALIKQVLEQCQTSVKEGGKDLTGRLAPRSLYRGMSLRAGDPAVGERSETEMEMWISEVQEADAQEEPLADLGFSALAYVQWRDQRGSSGALLALLGKDGKWTIHEGEEVPGTDETFPFEGSPLADFETAFTEFISEWTPSSEHWQVDFGAFKIPTAPAKPK